MKKILTLLPVLAIVFAGCAATPARPMTRTQIMHRSWWRQPPSATTRPVRRPRPPATKRSGAGSQRPALHLQRPDAALEDHLRRGWLRMAQRRVENVRRRGRAQPRGKPRIPEHDRGGDCAARTVLRREQPLFQQSHPERALRQLRDAAFKRRAYPWSPRSSSRRTSAKAAASRQRTTTAPSAGSISCYSTKMYLYTA